MKALIPEYDEKRFNRREFKVCYWLSLNRKTRAESSVMQIPARVKFTIEFPAKVCGYESFSYENS